MDLAAVALHGAFASAGEELDIVEVLNNDHGPSRGSSSVDDAIELDANPIAVVQRCPCGHRIIPRGNDNFEAG